MSLSNYDTLNQRATLFPCPQLPAPISSSPAPLTHQTQGLTESLILDYSEIHNISPCIVKPGFITNGEILKGAFATIMKWTGMVGNVKIEEIAAVMLEDVVEGFGEETVENSTLVERGGGILGRVG